MSLVRPARVSDAGRIGAIHVDAWRSAYAGVLPDAYLSGLSAIQQAGRYRTGLAVGRAAVVAEEAGQVVGFATMQKRQRDLADGEIETLYVLDDYRDRGIGRGLMRAAAQTLAADGCRSVFLWVLRDNPSRWFYERLHGVRVAEGRTAVAGVVVTKDAYVWTPIDRLLDPPAASEVPE